MNMLRNTSIRTLLVTTMGIVFSLFIVSVVVSQQAMNRVGQAFSDFIERDQALLLNFTELYANGLQIGQALRNIILGPQNPKAQQNFEQASVAMDGLLMEADKLAAGMPAAAEALRQIKPIRQAQKEMQAEIISLVEQGRSEAAVARLNSAETPAWRQIRATLMEQIKAQKSAIEAHEAQLQAATQRAQGVSLALSALAVGLGLVVGMAMVLKVGRGMRQLAQSMDGLASGHGALSARLPVRGNNELDQVALAFNPDCPLGRAMMARRFSSRFRHGRGVHGRDHGRRGRA